MSGKLDLSGVRIYSDTKEEELTKVRNAIAALLESLSHYTDRYGVKAYWDSYEGYEEFINSVVEACNIIERHTRYSDLMRVLMSFVLKRGVIKLEQTF